jgi:DNA-binding NarL/FixJ family response regulator
MADTRSPRRRSAGVRVVIADDHRTFAESLRLALDLERDIEVAAVCHDGAEVTGAVEGQDIDVVLMDLRMPVLDGLAAIRALREVAPETRIVALSAHDEDEMVAQAVDAGAVGFLPKTVPVKEVARLVLAASRGEQLLDPEEARRLAMVVRKRRQQDAGLRERVRRLSPRETEILQRMADGRSPKEIAAAMGISHHTLRTHVQNILFKLKVHSKVEALAAAIRFGKVRAGEDRAG